MTKEEIDSKINRWFCNWPTTESPTMEEGGKVIDLAGYPVYQASTSHFRLCTLLSDLLGDGEF